MYRLLCISDASNLYRDTMTRDNITENGHSSVIFLIFDAPILNDLEAGRHVVNSVFGANKALTR